MLAWDERKETYSIRVGKYVRNLHVKLFIIVRILKKKNTLLSFSFLMTCKKRSIIFVSFT